MILSGHVFRDIQCSVIPTKLYIYEAFYFVLFDCISVSRRPSAPSYATCLGIPPENLKYSLYVSLHGNLL
jgi:hypothetical protein